MRATVATAASAPSTVNHTPIREGPSAFTIDDTDAPSPTACCTVTRCPKPRTATCAAPSAASPVGNSLGPGRAARISATKSISVVRTRSTIRQTADGSVWE